MSFALGYLYPSGQGMVYQEFMDSVIGLISVDSNSRQEFRGYFSSRTAYIPDGRNKLCKVFLEQTECEWLLMVDYDVVFSTEQVYALLDSADPVERPIVAGVYVTWFGDDNSLRPCWMKEIDGIEYCPVPDWSFGLEQMTCVGMGFTLIHRGVLEKMQVEYADDPWHWFGHDIIGVDRVGEDITFCNRARKLGFTVWGNGAVNTGHIKQKVLTVDDVDGVAYSKATAFTPHTEVGKVVLNIGGGSKQIPLPEQYAGWKHVLFDVVPSHDVDILGDARDMPGVATNSYDAVYASHVIEHFSEHDAQKALDETYRVLKSGGTLEVRVPDLTAVIRRVADENLDIDSVLYESSAGPIRVIDVLYGHQASVVTHGSSMQHLTAFTLKTLRDAIVKSGFSDVRVTGANLELEAHAVKP